MADNHVDVAIEIDKDLYEKATKICRKFGLTVETIIEVFIQFISLPENMSLFEAYVRIQGSNATKEEYEKVSKDVFDKVFELVRQKKSKHNDLMLDDN